MRPSRTDGETVPGRRRSRSRGVLPSAIGWLLIAPLSVAVAARAARVEESSSLLVLAAGLTPLLVPPALVALGIGLGQRRRSLTVVSAATAGALLSSSLAGLGIPASLRAPAGVGATLRLFSANVHHANPAVGRVAEEIRAANPDLVALQEVDPDSAAELLRSGVLGPFPHAVTEIRRGASGIALWSRFPLTDVQVLEIGGMPLIGATVVLGARRLRLYTVHLIAPLGHDRLRWRAQLRRVEEQLRGHHGTLLVAGDFNATRYHTSFRRLLSDRLGDAHERRGRGWATTWPRDLWPLPPLLRLDHILVSPDIGVRAITEGDGQGSDHRPVIADLVLQEPA